LTAFGFLIGALAGTIISRKSAKEAIPMSGTCEYVTLSHYSDQDKDGKFCTWKGTTFWCVYDPNKDSWSCDSRGPVPAEKK
jgi:hypothetical protein